MKDKEVQKLIEASRKVHLSEDEKSAIKQTVLNFITNNPVRLGATFRLINQEVNSFWSTLFLTKLNFNVTMAILLILSVMVSGGIAVGAERSLPGDILYPIKIGLNEEVRGWVATSEEAKTDWEIKRAERRLEEAEELASDGSLDADTTAKIEANFEAHVGRVRDRIEKFNDKENFSAAASVSLNFEAALKAHEKILSKLAEREDKIKSQVRPIRVKVRSEVRKAATERRDMDIKIRGEADSSIEIENEDIDEVDVDSDLDLNFKGGSIRGGNSIKANIGL